ncbi:MAG: DUF2141 domain-containing protein [Candidatus Thiodiazotropha lotti]|nr:DUF2141 domain-containing protein [Candidatus Thiodiazotropha lotti]MCG7932227.1 DUF2141 domain-containing protein [Candidatus Thiodiazotropha lotti]MCG8004545.1 DUF2141 domain-containing protein [Candidatus Thiodiazotropha lotti]MCG8008900.1 DUF2141 domain-containing protein [Candidatus Thiodiazotropha lotti]MCG8021984.1 DUF2141 domain-containing protein [Candidatus Thiodiazotropha lotti]
MNKLIRIVLMGGIIAMAALTPALAKDITVRVINIDTTRPGNIMAMVFGSEGYPIKHGKALEIQNKKAENVEIIFRFNMTQKSFAIKILHDEDETGKTSKNWTGIWPSEGLGFSNGAKLGLTGAPSFKNARLDLDGIEGDIIVPIIYP